MYVLTVAWVNGDSVSAKLGSLPFKSRRWQRTCFHEVRPAGEPSPFYLEMRDAHGALVKVKPIDAATVEALLLEKVAVLQERHRQRSSKEIAAPNLIRGERENP